MHSALRDRDNAIPIRFHESGSSTPASCTFVLECSGGVLPDSAVVAAESAPASVVLLAALRPLARSIRCSGAWSLKYWRTVSQVSNGFNAPVSANAAPSATDGVPGAPPRVTRSRRRL